MDITQKPILKHSLGNITGENNQTKDVNMTEVGKSPSNTLDWSQLPTIVGLSAIISGGISALINYYSIMKQSKKQREVNVIQDMLSLYSLLIYHLDKLYEIGQNAFLRSTNAQDQTIKEEELKEILKTIDSSIQTKSYLLAYDAIAKWMSLKGN